MLPYGQELTRSVHLSLPHEDWGDVPVTIREAGTYRFDHSR
jgi:hypothetical protein